MKYFFSAIIPLLFLLAGCKNDVADDCAFVPTIATPAPPLAWEALEDSLPAFTTKQEFSDFFARHTMLRDVFFDRPSYPSDSVFINDLFRRFTNPAMDTLLQDTRRVFGDLSELKQQFAVAFANVKYFYPDFQPPKIQTVITGMYTDVFVTDSLVLVGLDHFLGPGAHYELNMHAYMRKRYRKDFIVPSVMLLYGIDSRYNRIDPADRTILADMVAYGKAYYFCKSMVPCVPDSVLIGYTTKEITGAKKYENLIWSRLIEDEILFSTNNQDKQKYIIERPKTLEVGDECPGRIGTWVGWQIVNAYHQSHPDKQIGDIMETTNAEGLFRESGYRPQIVQLPGQKKL